MKDEAIQFRALVERVNRLQREQRIRSDKPKIEHLTTYKAGPAWTRDDSKLQLPPNVVTSTFNAHGKSDVTKIAVDPPQSCPNVDHADGWHLYMTHDGKRIVRMCPREAATRTQASAKRDQDSTRSDY